MNCFKVASFTKKRLNLAFGWMAWYSPIISCSISGIFLKFVNFLSRLATREATRRFALW